jgi:hypothetical protein
MTPIRAFESIGPGKFSSRADQRAYRRTLDGCTDDFCGDSSADWCASKIGPLLGLARAGAIVFEDSQGFVTVDYYDDPAALEREWERVQNEAPCECDDEECDKCHPITTDEWRLAMHSHCGMLAWEDSFEDEREARFQVAGFLRHQRHNGMTVQPLGRRAVRHGRELPRATDSGFHAGWEITEPEDSVMVPDTAGILVLTHFVKRS